MFGVVTLTPASDVFSIATALASTILGYPPFSPPNTKKLKLEECAAHSLREEGALEKALVGPLMSKTPSLVFLASWVGTATKRDPLLRFPTASAAVLSLVSAALQGMKGKDEGEAGQ